jgi:hypothetical protein
MLVLGSASVEDTRRESMLASEAIMVEFSGKWEKRRKKSSGAGKEANGGECAYGMARTALYTSAGIRL